MPSPGREVEPDFEAFCACLNRHGVDYVIVGSEAVAVHGAPRFSQDFDVFIRATAENACSPRSSTSASERRPRSWTWSHGLAGARRSSWVALRIRSMSSPRSPASHSMKRSRTTFLRHTGLCPFATSGCSGTSGLPPDRKIWLTWPRCRPGAETPTKDDNLGAVGPEAAGVSSQGLRALPEHFLGPGQGHCPPRPAPPRPSGVQ